METRFWEDVTKLPDLPGCWPWAGREGTHGYGVVAGSSGKKLAHRVSWEIHNGPVPGHLQVLHKCDVRLCVNPDHLFLGTQMENIHDCLTKGRASTGERHYRAKLTPEKVTEIRLRWAAGGVSQKQLAKEYDMHHGAIQCVVERRTWKAVH